MTFLDGGASEKSVGAGLGMLDASLLGVMNGCPVCCFEGGLNGLSLVVIFAEIIAGSLEISGALSKTEMSLIT